MLAAANGIIASIRPSRTTEGEWTLVFLSRDATPIGLALDAALDASFQGNGMLPRSLEGSTALPVRAEPSAASASAIPPPSELLPKSSDALENLVADFMGKEEGK